LASGLNSDVRPQEEISVSAILIATIANVVAMVSAIVAAALWYKSAVVKVALTPGGTGSPEILVDGYAFVSTAKAQTSWSRRAAVAASVAALFQGIGLAATLVAA
jgi:hypothetical protein